ncbi:hypothetical protein Cfor_11582 [Coptotermes formosanus]|uniref:Tower domain-containing protein n=1 Tax=Coptotermes formosanus TaxID=36987 RepID=A0A6L2PYE5_COPFO|nr:hypothetical protein Cfor_11582 [Coptotermes formosanus]
MDRQKWTGIHHSKHQNFKGKLMCIKFCLTSGKTNTESYKTEVVLGCAVLSVLVLFRLSPIPPLQMGGGTIPESLEPLLEEGSDMSWNSAFVTPLARSVTCSSLTSSERKVLMPLNSHRNPRVLFSGDESMDAADCSEKIDSGSEEMSQKSISDTTVLDENSAVDKTEFNMQDFVLSHKENILCSSSCRYETDCKRTVDSPVTGTVGNLLEEKSSYSVNLSMDIIQKYNEAKDPEASFQRVKSDLVQSQVQEICSSGSSKERSQYNVLQRHSFIKSPDSGMNDFTENSAEIDFGSSSPLVSSISARVTVPRRLFHGNRHVGVHGEAAVTQLGVARAQTEDSGAVACDEISQRRSSGSVGMAKLSQYDSLVSNKVATSAVHSTEDFPQDLSINTLEEICQVTELLAADTDTSIEFSQNPDDTYKNKETPVCVQLSSPDKSCLCRTSTPICCRNKHSKLNSGTRKKRIKFVPVSDNEKPNKHDENVRVGKENIQKQYECEEWQHGGNSDLEQCLAVLDNNSVVGISARVQTIKKTLNQIKKFTYVPSNVEIKAAVTQDSGLNVLMEDVVKSAQAMENVVGIKAKHNNVGKFSAIASDRTGFIPFCKLDRLPRFVAKGESSEDFKLMNGVMDTSDSTGEPILRSSNHSLSSNTGEACDQAVSIGNGGNINKFIVSGGTHTGCKNMCSAQCDSGTGVQEQSRFLRKDAHAARKFQQSSEAEEPCNTSDTRCATQGDFSKQLDDCRSGSKCEMEYEFSRPNQTTEKFGFKNNVRNQARLPNEALLKNVSLFDDTLMGEKVPVSPGRAFRVPGQDLKCEELKDTKVSAVCSPYIDISCEQCNATPGCKSDMFDGVFRQGHILDKNNSSLICARNIKKQETVRHLETKAYQNCNWNETATEENTLSFLEDKREGENMVTDLQIVLAAEDAELMQQLVEDGSMYSQWPSEIHAQEMEVCEKINSPTAETKFNFIFCCGKGNAEQKESCACSHVTRKPQEEDVSVSDGRNKSLYSKLTALCTSGYQNVEVSERNLQEIGQWHETDIICDSTEREGNESSIFNKVVQIMNVSNSSSINQVKKPRSEEVHIEEVLNTAGIRQPFSDNFDTSEIENRLQMLINKPENDILNVDHSVLTPPDSRMQNVQPEVTEYVASHDLRMETLLYKSDSNMNTATENMGTKLKTGFPIEYPGTTQLLRANGRNPSVSGRAALNTEGEDEQQKFGNIQVIDFASDPRNIKLIKSNIGVGERGLCEKLGETDDSVQAPVTDTRNLFEAKSLTPLKFQNVHDYMKNTGKSDQDIAETPSCLLEKESHLQQLLQQRDGTVNVPEQVCVGNVEVPDENVAISSSRAAQNPGDLLQNAQSIVNCDNNMAVDGITTVGSRKVVVSAKELRTKHMFPEVDANIPSRLRNSQCPTLDCPDAVGAALIHNVSNTQYSGHGTESSELDGTKEEGFSYLQGLSVVRGKQFSLSFGSLNRAKLLFSNKESQKGELVTEFLETAMKQKESLFKECKTASSVQISEPLNVPDFVISEVDTTMVEHKTEREVEERGRQALPLFQGFKTASGNEVFVSAKALNRAKMLFSEEEIDTEPTKNEIIASKLNDPQKINTPVLHRFSVASKKGIGESANTSDTSKLLFSEAGTCTESAKDGPDASEIEEKAERPHSPVFQGFSSASGKRVSVSAMALKRARQMFSEEESCKELVADETSIPELQEKEEPHSPVSKGFSTASGKRVNVSAMALKRARQMFSEEESCKELVADITSILELQEQEGPHSPVSKGFSTASGKRVNVSAMALKRARQMFSEEESCKELVADETSTLELQEQEEPHSPVSKGFSTASGKRVNVSAMALKRARQMFSEEESCKELVADETSIPELQEKEEPHSPVSKGFSTASGKRVNVSAMALKRAREMFSEEESCKELVTDETSIPELQEKEEPHSPVSKGFSTASGKRVSVSAMALKRARQMFSEEESCKELVADETSIPELPEKEEPHSPVSKGFSTASDETSIPELQEKEEPHSPVLKGFSTASCKRVSVSAMALKRARQMFSEEESCKELVADETSIPELQEKEEPHSPVLKGFSTASGKRVSISAMALKRARQMFSEEESCKELVADESSIRELQEKAEPCSPVLKRFSTASDKKVSLSAVGLKRAKLMFLEEEICKELITGETTIAELKRNKEQHLPLAGKTAISGSENLQNQGSPVKEGFLTASGRQVFISATGLNRDSVLFSEVAAAHTEVDAREGDDCYLNEKKEVVSQISQKLLPVSESCESESAECQNTEGQFISVYDTCKTKYLEFEKSSVNSQTSPRQIVPFSKEMPKQMKFKLARRVSGQEKSIKILQSEQISSSRPLFLNANQRKTEDCKQGTSVSEEICHRAETLIGFTSMPNIKRKLDDYHHPIIQFDSSRTGSTGAKGVKDKERYDLGRGTPQHDDVTEEHKTDGGLVSLTQEVKESAAALLADEAMFNSPAWIGSYVSCPDMLYDRCTGPPALVCSEGKDCSAVTAVDPGSPVLGSHDHLRKRRRVTVNADDLGHNMHAAANSSFKVNHLRLMLYCNRYLYS